MMEVQVLEAEMGAHTGRLRVNGMASVRCTGHRLETWAINEQRPGLCYPWYQGLEIGSSEGEYCHLAYNSTPTNYSIDVLILVGNDMGIRICGIGGNGQRLETM